MATKPIYKTITNAAVANFTTEQPANLKGFSVNIDPTLDGVSAVNVVRTGKNILPYTLATIKAANSGTWSVDNKLTVNGITYEVVADSNGSVTDIIVSGTATANAQLWLIQSSGFANYPSGTLNGVTGGSNTTYWFDMMAEGSGNVPVYDGDVTFNPTQKYRPRVIVLNGCAITGEIHIKPMLRKTGDATYEPYTPTTRTISLGQTVYGGSVTVDEDGECELEKTYNLADLALLEWEQHQSISGIFRAAISQLTDPVRPAVGVNQNTVCDLYTPSVGTSSLADQPDKTIVIGRSGVNYLIVRNNDCATLAAFEATLTGETGFAYPKATPTTSELDPIDPIKTLAGVNNIWADTGDILSLTYLERYNYIIEEPVMDISSPLGALWEQAAGIDGTYPIGNYALLVTKGGDCLATKNGELLEIKGGS